MQEQERSGVINVGGMEYAVGMFWQTAEDPKSVKREAKLAAKQEVNPADLFVMREGFVAQWAIGWTTTGHKQGMPAGAACLAGALAGNWLAVFHTDAGWWFVASRRDAILPDGDILYDNEDEPRTRFETEFVRGGWDRVFTPEEWGMGGDTSPLDEVLAGHEEPKLSYLHDFFTRLPKSVKMAAVAALAGVAIVGYIGVEIYNGIMEDKRLEEEKLARDRQEALRARMEAERLEKERLAKLRQQEKVARIWEDEPNPSDWMVACADALDRISVEVPGWVMQGMGCSGGSAGADWKISGGGSLASARYGLRDVANPSISAKGDSMSARLPLNDLTPRGPQTGWKIDEIRANFLQLFQGLGGDVRLDIVARPSKPPDDDPLNPRPRPPAHFKFQFQSTLTPMVWASIFEQFPGLVVDSVSLKIGSQTWLYAGRVYEELTDQEIQQQNAALENAS